MIDFVYILVDGLIAASSLFIIASGLTLIYGVQRILNMAHGSLYAIGVYVAAFAVGIWYADLGFEVTLFHYVGLLAMLIPPLVVGALVGAGVEFGVLRRLYRRDELVMVLATFGLLLIFEDLIKIVFGADALYAFQPYDLFGNFEPVPQLIWVSYDLVLIGVAGLIALVLWYGLERTRHGKLLRVVIHDREIAVALGIDVKRVFLATFAIGCVLAALGGALVAPRIPALPGIGVEVIVIAFAVVVTGGLGSIMGALVGALLIGIARAATIHLFPALELFVIYAVMALVLAFRPHGLFALPAARKI